MIININKSNRKYTDLSFGLIIFIVALIIRLLAVVYMKVQPESDFLFQYEAATLFSQNNFSFSNEAYFQVWGYQTGLVIFNGLLLKIWNSLLFLKIINAISNSFIAVLIYLIAKQFFNKKHCLIGGLLYAIYPFQATFVTILSNQHISVLLDYLGIYVICANQKFKNEIIKITKAGVLIALGNAIRPDAIIIVFALFLFWLLNFLVSINTRNFAIFIKKSTVFVGSYLLVGILLSNLVIATGINPIGLANKDPLWNFVLGSNYESHGQWNSKDGNLIRTKIAQQNISRKEAEVCIVKDRAHNLITSPLKLLKLWLFKMRVFWLESGILWGLKNHHYFDFIYFIDVLFFHLIVLLALISVFIIFRKYKWNSEVYIILLILLTSIGVYSLIEVQARYSYLSKVAVFIIIPAVLQWIFKVNRIKSIEVK